MTQYVFKKDTKNYHVFDIVSTEGITGSLYFKKDQEIPKYLDLVMFGETKEVTVNE